MKTKKILAIVTLVAFMISILPMAAFAAATNVNSTVYMKTDSATADNEDYIEFDVLVRNGSNLAATSNTLQVSTSRNYSSVVDTIYFDEAVATPTLLASGGYVAEYNMTSSPVANNGWVNVRIYSATPNSLKVAVGIKDLQSAGATIPGFLAGTTGHTAITAATVSDTKGNHAIPVTFTARSANKVQLTSPTGTVNANGASYQEVKAMVTAGGTPVANTEVTFSLDRSGATLSTSKVTTDSKGEAKVKIFATKAGDYKVTGKVDGVDAAIAANPQGLIYKTVALKMDEAVVKFGTPGVTTIKAESDNNQKIAKESSGTVDFDFSFGDANGNTLDLTTVDIPLIASGGLTSGGSANINLTGSELRVSTKPSGAAISEKFASADGAFAIDDGNLELKVNKSKLDKEGDYSIKLILPNGKTAQYDFTVKKQGTVTGMTLKYKSSSMAARTGNVLAVDSIKLVDAEGYSTSTTNVDFAIDNNAIAKVTNSPVPAGESLGQITLSDDKTGVINVTAIEKDKKLVANATINVEKAASSLKVTAPTYNKVGEDAKVTVQLVDIDGKPVSGGYGSTAVNHAAYVISKPDGAITSVETGKGVTSDFNDKGTYTFDVTSNTVGVVKVQVTATVATTPTPIVYTGSATVNFGDVATAQKPLTMFIGSINYMVGGAPAVTDAAPFIQNGRTFVAVRPIGDALGATINWDAATQTVTLTKPGEIVTIVIGASTIKIDRAGVVTEYPTDAPAQIKDGRTYLPFRAIGEAMGYEVNFDAATQAVTFK